MRKIRQSLGVCPQHDVLFKVLTVFEHLELFARIKGIPEGRISAESNKVLEDVGLMEKKDKYAFSVSTRRRRRTCSGSCVRSI
jgi:ATP-binding cassette subfamily A (ABC1) protein 3